MELVTEHIGIAVEGEVKAEVERGAPLCI